MREPVMAINVVTARSRWPTLGLRASFQLLCSMRGVVAVGHLLTPPVPRS